MNEHLHMCVCVRVVVHIYVCVRSLKVQEKKNNEEISQKSHKTFLYLIETSNHREFTFYPCLMTVSNQGKDFGTFVLREIEPLDFLNSLLKIYKKYLELDRH